MLADNIPRYTSLPLQAEAARLMERSNVIVILDYEVDQLWFLNIQQRIILKKVEMGQSKL